MLFSFLEILLLILLGITLYLFTFILSKVRRKKGNIFLASLILAVFFVLLKGIFHANDDLTYYPELLFLPIYWTTGFGALIYLFVKYSIQIKNPTGRDVIHFTPLLLQVVFHLFWYVATSKEKIQFYTDQYFSTGLLFEEAIAIGLMTIYMIKTFVLLKKFWNSQRDNLTPLSKQNVLWLWQMIGAWSSFLLLWITYTITDYYMADYTFPYEFYYPLYGLIYFLIFWIAYRVTKTPEFLTNHLTYPFSRKEEIQFKDLKESFEELVIPKIFDSQSTEYGLEQIAQILEISRHQLKNFLKKQYNLSYTGYIRSQRMKKFEEMTDLELSENNTPSIGKLRLKCGYSATQRSSFNRDVRNIFSCSPSEFIEQRMSQFKQNQK